MPKVNARKANPEIEADAWSEGGAVVVKLGENEISLSPTDAQELADLICEASDDANEGVDTQFEDDDETEVEEEDEK